MATDYMYSPQAYGPFSGGPQNGYANKGANGHKFSFRNRVERVDWRKLASLDIDLVSRNLDFSSLQENIMNVTFCNIESEIDCRSVDPNFIKLFKLAQLCIEYLLHSQEYLSSLITGHEEKLRKAQQEHQETKKKLDVVNRDMADVKKESHKRKKLLIAQQQLIHNGSGSYNKCPFCPKAFINSSFLQSHLNRRHNEYTGGKPSSSVPVSASTVTPAANPAFEAELLAIKERLQKTEAELYEERRASHSLKRKDEEIMKKIEVFNVPDVDVAQNRKELEDIRSMFMNEMKDLHEKYQSSEVARVEMEQRFGKKSNLGVLQDDDEYEKQTVEKRKQEMSQLEGHFQQQFDNLQAAMDAKVSEQEKKWQKKVHRMTKQHKQEINNLNEALEKTSSVISQHSLKGQSQAEDMQIQREAENVLRKSREKEKVLEFREEEMHRVISRQNTPTPREEAMNKKIKRNRSLSPKPNLNNNAGLLPKMHITKMEPSDDEETTDMLTTRSSMTTTKQSLRSTGTLGATGQMTLGTDEFIQQFRKNPKMQEVRDSLAVMLQGELEKRGIPPTATGISAQTLANKLTMLKTQRKGLLQKYPDLQSHRNYYDRLSEDKARELFNSRRISPPPSTRVYESLGSTGSAEFSELVDYNKLSPPRVSRPPAKSPSPTPRNLKPSVSPRPAPRASSPGRTLHSTGSTTEWTSTNWDSDEESESDLSEEKQPNVRVIKSTPMRPQPNTQKKELAPSPRVQPRVVMSKPVNDLDDWDNSISELDYGPSSTAPAVMSRPGSGAPGRGAVVANLSKTIESQMSKRTTGNRPAGGVDVMGSAKPPAKKQISSDFDDDSFLSDDDDPKPPKRHMNIRSSHASDTSANTYGTSVWGGSSTRASTVNQPTRQSSLTDVSFDEEIDLDNI